MNVKALYFGFDKAPFKDMEQLIQIAKSEGAKVLGTKKLKVLNILSCSYPKGYIALVVQNPGRRKEQKE